MILFETVFRTPSFWKASAVVGLSLLEDLADVSNMLLTTCRHQQRYAIVKRNLVKS